MLHNAPPPTGSTVANSGTGVQPPSTSDGGCPDTEYDDMATMELRRQIYVDLVRMRRDFPEHHRNAVARILFIFAQMHPDISYVQVRLLNCKGRMHPWLTPRCAMGAGHA